MNQNKIGTEMKKTLGLMGITMNAMALIAPGAFLWITYQVQAAQIDPAGATTAADMWFGLLAALALAFLTAGSYAMLARRYPEAGTGSSYYFAEKALIDRGSSRRAARITKFTVGWLSHLYYWVYPGVMVAFMAVLVTFILQTFGLSVSPVSQIGIATAFAVLTGLIAYRGIIGSTRTNIILNIVQLVMLVGVTTMALVYRFLNPQNVNFVFPTLVDVVQPHNGSHVLFQATIAILLLVGFESATALMAEAKKPSYVTSGVLLSLAIQGLFAYLLEYFGAQVWINEGYKVVVNGKVLTGFEAAAQSSAPIGDMVRNLGNVLFAGHGFEIMLVVAAAVGAAILGSILASLNTGIRVTYAMACEREVPMPLGKLHERYATPNIGVWLLTFVSAIIGAFGVLSVRNLLVITLLSNIGTFLIYGLTNIIAFIALAREHMSVFLRRIIPLLGAAANIVMLLAVVWLGILGGGDTQFAALAGLVARGAWVLIGIAYFITNSITEPSTLLPYSGKTPQLTPIPQLFKKELKKALAQLAG